MSVNHRRSVLVLAVCGLLVFAAGCRENEQGRVLYYEKGTYQGPEDTPRSADEEEDLQLRVHQQRAP